ncbi:hypothetical protein SPHV1_2270127 [Novosphingobium sp. KN65.2]|nr:hypothetical protein SPHV1_2270127 [Novosphingobium sp. KN65.2]
MRCRQAGRGGELPAAAFRGALKAPERTQGWIHEIGVHGQFLLSDDGLDNGFSLRKSKYILRRL